MNKKAHFIGICGVGMGSVAILLKEQGWEVTGSDTDFYPPMSTELTAHDISYAHGYRAENIPEGVDLIVIGKNAKLVPESNEEVRAAFASGISVKHFAEVLGDIAAKTRNIVVAGSYGKSTCAALLSWCLTHAGKDPSYFFGAVSSGTQKSIHIGKGPLFVLEGDEYPSSNWDSSSKFLHYHAHDVLLTATAHDHINAFPTHEDFLAPFKRLLADIPDTGTIVACTDDTSNRELLSRLDTPYISYGLQTDAQWHAADITYGEETSFTLVHNGDPIVHLTTALLGEHNIQNIVGVSAMLLANNLLSPEELHDGIATFAGLTRRLDLKTKKSSVYVFEGFGTSYEKAKASHRAIKKHFPEKRLIVVFDPHTFSWRNRGKIHWYDDVFKEADHVLIYTPESQGAGTHEQLTHEEIVARAKDSGVSVEAITSAHAGLDALERMLKHDDIVLIQSSGDAAGFAKSIPVLAEKLYPRI